MVLVVFDRCVSLLFSLFIVACFLFVLVLFACFVLRCLIAVLCFDVFVCCVLLLFV